MELAIGIGAVGYGALVALFVWINIKAHRRN